MKLTLKRSFVCIFTIFAISIASLSGISANKAFGALPVTQNSVGTADSIPEQNVKELEHFEHKDSGLVTFGFSMLGVFISAGIIFLCLKIYQKYFMKKRTNQPDSFGQKDSLDSPKDIKSAVSLFIDKTED